jgi:hypothetical protein
LALQSCNFPGVTVMVQPFFASFQFLRNIHTRDWDGLFLPAVHGTCTPVQLRNHYWGLSCPIQGLTEYEISLPRVNDWHLFPIPLLKSSFQARGTMKKMCHLERKSEFREEGGPPLPSQTLAFQYSTLHLDLCPKRISKKETSLCQTV